jgi:hypothetical protein
LGVDVRAAEAHRDERAADVPSTSTRTSGRRVHDDRGGGRVDLGVAAGASARAHLRAPLVDRDLQQRSTSSTSSVVPASMRSAVEPSRISARPPLSAHSRSPVVIGRLTKASPHSSGRPAGASDTGPVT